MADCWQLALWDKKKAIASGEEEGRCDVDGAAEEEGGVGGVRLLNYLGPG